jgi:3-oxoacyl-[acyl-carrier protein] reductase
MGTLAGRNALITGGSRGIGRAIVERFAAEGASVVFTYCTHKLEAEAIVESLGGRSGRITALRADVASVVHVRRLFAKADSVLDGIDVVVNNAGIGGGRDTTISDATEEFYDRLMNVNTKGLFFCLQEAARRVRDGGRIINLSSSVTQRGLAGTAVYAASKAAVERFSATAAKELGHRQIAVNTISPGATATDLFREANGPDIVKTIEAMSPLGRIGTTWDISAVAAFLAGPDSGWITGQTLRADGGIS